MPIGLTFTDKDGSIRSEIRTKWWENPATMTYKSISVIPLENLPDAPIETTNFSSSDYYKSDEKFVFFGHYWLKGEPTICKNNVCCLDYSVAKEGKLVAYRLDNESELDNSKLVFV